MCWFTGHLRRCLLGTASLGLVIFVLGCSPRSTPPGPNTIGSSAPGLSFTFLQWKEGLMLLLVDDIHLGSHHEGGSGSTNNPVFSESGSAASADGRGYKWQLETTDGKAATFRIDGKEYDLSQGGVFVFQRKADKVEVHQMKRDLSAVPFDTEGCREFLKKDAEILEALGAGDLPK
jgi:hypothetical protein